MSEFATLAASVTLARAQKSRAAAPPTARPGAGTTKRLPLPRAAGAGAGPGLPGAGAAAGAGGGAGRPVRTGDGGRDVAPKWRRRPRALRFALRLEFERLRTRI
jgi:hypothetical protein